MPPPLFHCLIKKTPLLKIMLFELIVFRLQLCVACNRLYVCLKNKNEYVSYILIKLQLCPNVLFDNSF